MWVRVAPSVEGTSYWLWCPACDDAVRLTDAWEFDGNLTHPTFAPSILTTTATTRCHSYLTAGVWRYLDDCSHGYAGQSLPTVPLPGWLASDY